VTQVVVSLTKPVQSHYLLAAHPSAPRTAGDASTVADHNEDSRFLVEVRAIRRPRPRSGSRSRRTSREVPGAAADGLAREHSVVSLLPTFEILVFAADEAALPATGAGQASALRPATLDGPGGRHVHFAIADTFLEADGAAPKACRVDDDDGDGAGSSGGGTPSASRAGSKRRHSGGASDGGAAHPPPSHRSPRVTGESMEGVTPSGSGRARRNSVEEVSLLAREGRRLLARCRPTGHGGAYDIDLVVAPKYNSLKHWAEVACRVPAVGGASAAHFALQISNGPNFWLQRIHALSGGSGGAARAAARSLSGAGASSGGGSSGGGGSGNKVHPSDGGAGEDGGGSGSLDGLSPPGTSSRDLRSANAERARTLFELRLADHAAAPSPGRARRASMDGGGGGRRGSMDGGSDRDAAWRSVSPQGSGGGDLRRTSEGVSPQGGGAAARFDSLSVFGDSQVAVIGVRLGKGSAHEEDRGGGGGAGSSIAVEIHPAAADIAPGLVCLAHLLHALHNADM